MANFNKINIDGVPYDVEDTTARDSVAAESTARQQADTQLQQADTQLQQAITLEETAREQADTQLGQQISEETEAREQADAQLQQQIAGIDLYFPRVDLYSSVATSSSDPTTRTFTRVHFPSYTSLTLIPTGSLPSGPYNNCLYCLNQNAGMYTAMCNASLSGAYKLNGVEYPDRFTDGEAWSYMVLENGRFKQFVNKTDTSATQLMTMGDTIFGAWSPIILNGSKYDQSVYSSSGKYDEIVNHRHPRTVIASDGTSFDIIWFHGTLLGADGYTYDEMYSALSEFGYSWAYNLDGGGSCFGAVMDCPFTTCTDYNNPYYRPVPTLLGVKK